MRVRSAYCADIQGLGLRSQPPNPRSILMTQETPNARQFGASVNVNMLSFTVKKIFISRCAPWAPFAGTRTGPSSSTIGGTLGHFMTRVCPVLQRPAYQAVRRLLQEEAPSI